MTDIELKYATSKQALVARPINNQGVWVGLVIISLWIAGLCLELNLSLSFLNPWVYVLFLVQTHLYTGLFITAHDAMHGLISPNKRMNNAIGWLAAGLFAFNYYPRLLHNHKLHHTHAATNPDPDYNSGGFWKWYASFLGHYITIWQFLAMAVMFNVLQIWFPMDNLIVFWMAPAILSTFQLFYFGTYQPHSKQESNPSVHKARSQGLNHTWAFLTCYFFGYHNEHHAMPWLPWYKLPKARELSGEQKG